MADRVGQHLDARVLVDRGAHGVQDTLDVAGTRCHRSHPEGGALPLVEVVDLGDCDVDCCIYLGEADAAVANHRKAIELEPGDHLAWSNLGDALWVSGSQQEAEEAFRHAEQLAAAALKINPNDTRYLMDLAWISMMLGDEKRARALIGRARELAEDDPYVHYYEGLILLLGGDREGALFALERAVAEGYPLGMFVSDPQLAGLQALFGHSVWTLRLLGVVCGMAGLWALFLFLRELLGRRVALVACALYAIAPWTTWSIRFWRSAIGSVRSAPSSTPAPIGPTKHSGAVRWS